MGELTMGDIERLRAAEAALGPPPWAWKKLSRIDWGYVDASGKPTVMFGERYEGAVDEDDTDAVALSAIRNALPALLDAAERGLREDSLDATIRENDRHAGRLAEREAVVAWLLTIKAGDALGGCWVSGGKQAFAEALANAVATAAHLPAPPQETV